MKVNCYAETDSLYIALQATAGDETREIAPGVNADFASDGTLVGLDIDGASRFDLSTLESSGVPIRTLKAA